MDDVRIEWGDGSIDYNVATEEEAVALVKSKTGSNENAYEWDKSSKRLIQKPPAATTASAGTWSGPVNEKHILFMYADQQVTFGNGDGNIEFPETISAKITWASFGILGVASLIISI